jgi:hypothetical protein
MAEIKQAASATKPGTVIKIPKDLADIFEKERETAQILVFGGSVVGPAPGYNILSEALFKRIASNPDAMKAILRDNVVVVVPKEQIQF